MAVESSGLIWIGDKLPNVYDASIQIFFLSPTPTSLQREHVVQKYCDSLVDVWQRSFGKEFVVNEKTVKRTLLSIMVAYDKRIKNRYGDQRIGKPFQSIRQVNKEWYRYCIEHISEFTPKEAKGRPKKGVQRQQPVPTSSTCLLDIGKNTANLTGDEKIFYEDQKNERRWTLSKEVDVEYEEERRKKFNEHVATQEREVMEESFQYPPDYEEDLSPSSSTALDRSVRHAKRSGVNEVLYNNETKETQTPYIGDIDEMLFPRPDIRQSRNVSDNVKDAIATISYRAGVSVPKARVAFQAACEKAYNHQYYLTADEQKKFEPMLTDEVNDEEVQEPYAKVPRTTEDFRKYKFVLPSAKVVREFKHNKALHQEIQAGKALTKLDEGTRVTFHFDTTSRSRIDGEWPSLILNFLNEDSDKCKVFYLRALFFAFEDREQIVKLFVETLKRLSVATGGVASPQHLWENIYSFMTDSVHKNLKIEYGIAEVLESDHIPHHVLCKAHVCEKLDGACLNALIQLETELKPRATQLHKLSHDERRLMATENLICERYLGGMGSLAAVSAAKSNKFFKGKRMRDDLVFDNKTAPTDEVMVLKTTKVVAKELNLMEMSWTAEQRVKLKEKIEEAVKKNTRTGNYRDLLLKKCKSHGGPVTSIEDVTYLVNKTDDKKKLKSSLRSEIGFQKLLHPFDAKERSYLYKMNFLSAEELAENLTILLDVTQNPDAAEDFELPSEEEMYEIICGDADSSGYPPAAAAAIDDEVKPSFAALEPLAVI